MRKRKIKTNLKYQAEFKRQAKQLKDNIEWGITSAALQLGDTSEDIAQMLPNVIGLWNTKSKEIEQNGGRGFFPVRLRHADAVSVHFVNGTNSGYGSYAHALSVLTWLAATTDDYAYKWMVDFLRMLAVPERPILRESGGRNSVWHRRLRKTKLSEFLAEAKATADERADLVQNSKDDFTQKVLRAHREFDRQVRSAPGYKDFTVGRAQKHGKQFVYAESFEGPEN